MGFDLTARFRAGLPPADGGWQPAPRFSFVGGHNDADNVPFGGLAEAAVQALRREGPKLATYNLGGSPLGYEPLREFVAGALGARAALSASSDEVLVTSGSLQALDLVNGILLAPGDTVIVEEATYGGMVSRLRQLGVDVVGVGLDADGIRTDHLDELLGGLASRGRTVKYVYTIPTVQNPTGSVMSLARRHELLAVCRRHEVAIFEDDCYADLLWDGPRPPAIRALDAADPDGGGQVIYCGSFSKSIAPALRIGYVVADAAVLRQMLALKTDAGTGALEQLVLAEYATAHFDSHVDQLRGVLQAKCVTMCEAVNEHFGDRAAFTAPRGGIFLWLELTAGTDTAQLVAPAAAEGIEFNPGAGWSADPKWGKTRLRLCFGHPDAATIREGVARLAAIERAAG